MRFNGLRINDIFRCIVGHLIGCVFVTGWLVAWNLKRGVADTDVDAGFVPVSGERWRDGRGCVEQALKGCADITIQEHRHRFAGYGIEVLPGGVANEDFALLSLEGSYQSVELGVWRAVQTDEDGSETAGSAVGGEVEFFLPTALSRSGDRDTNLELIGAVVEQAIDLPTFAPITVTFHGTLLGRCGSATDGVRDDRLEQVSRFLSGAIVDVVEPLPPKQETGQGIAVELSELQQAARTDLLQRGKWLSAEDSLVLEPGLVHRSEAREVGIRICLRGDETLEECFGIQPGDDQFFQRLAAEEQGELLREFGKLIDDSQILDDSPDQVRTAFIGEDNRLCSVSE